MKKRQIKTFVSILLIILFSLPIRLYSYDSVDEAESKELRYNLVYDLAAIGVSGAGFLATEVFKDDLAPGKCRWCGVNSFDGWGHNNLKWSNTGAAGTVSDVMAFGLAPMVSFGLDALASHMDGDLNNFGVDALVIAESAAVSLLFTQIIKFSVGRERPEAHYGGVSNPKPSENLSFYSGHTDLAFALAVSSGTVATMRGYRLAPYIWGAGMAVAATTGYLRIAADKHYITDVIGGAVIGSAFGFGIPYLFHRPHKENSNMPMVSAIPADGGMVLGISGTL